MIQVAELQRIAAGAWRIHRRLRFGGRLALTRHFRWALRRL